MNCCTHFTNNRRGKNPFTKKSVWNQKLCWRNVHQTSTKQRRIKSIHFCRKYLHWKLEIEGKGKQYFWFIDFIKDFIFKKVNSENCLHKFGEV